MGYVGNQAVEGYSSIPAKQDLTGATGTSLTLTHPVSSAESIDLFINNVRQEPTTAYTVAGTTVTLTGSVVDTDDIYVVYNGLALQTTVPPDGSVTSAKLASGSVTSAKLDTNIAVTGDLTVDTSTLHVDSTNNRVGIGTSSPSHPLHTYRSSAGTIAEFRSEDGTHNPRLSIYGDSSGTHLHHTWSSGASNLIFEIGGSAGTNEKMRLDSSGNLLVGATSPIASGKITAQATGTNPAVVAQGASDCFQGRTTQTSGTSYFAYWLYNGSNVGSITSTGSTTSYNTSSDYRLKENVTDITGATDRLKQLNPVRFNFIADADTTVDGFLAHEVQTVVPEAITGTHNQVEVWTQDQIDAREAPENTSAGDNKLDDDGNTIPVYQGIDQSKLVPLLVATIQELEARIAALESA